MSAETTDYAVCVDEGCGIPLPTPEDVRAHRDATWTPTGLTTGVTARAHAWRVLNPTREEVVRRAVGYEIEQATNRAFEELDREIDAGRLTLEEVTHALIAYPDFSDGWDEWLREDGR